MPPMPSAIDVRGGAKPLSNDTDDNRCVACKRAGHGWRRMVAGFFLTVMAAHMTCGAFAGDHSDLGSFQWKHRLVIHLAPDGADLDAIASRYDDQSSGLQDRDILFWIISGDSFRSNHHHGLSNDIVTRQKLQTGWMPSQTRVILIGKDGGTKEAWNGIDFDTLYAAIDAMPMRQEEMAKPQVPSR